MDKKPRGVAFEDLGWDIDEMAEYDGFFEWLMEDDSEFENCAVWNEEKGCWEYPEDNEEEWTDAE